MKPLKKLLHLFLFIGSFSQSGTGQIQGLDITDYDIRVSLCPSRDTLNVLAVCATHKTDAAAEVRLLLSSRARIRSIRAHSDRGSSPVPFTFRGKDSLQLNFPESTTRRGLLTLTFDYALPIDPLADSLLLLDRGSRWYPLVPDQIARVRLGCTVPVGYTVLSAGDLVDSRPVRGMSQFRWKTGLPIFKIPLVVFRSDSMRRDSVAVMGKSIVLYTLATKHYMVDSILNEATKAFTYFTGLIGEYPHRNLTMVEIPYFDGIDVSTGLLMVGSPSLEGVGKGECDPLYLTVAQQWMGAGVFAKFRQPGFWFFTISLPHYLRLMYIRHSRGEDSYATALQGPLAKYGETAGKENDVPILDVDFPNTREKGLILYGKGPYAVAMLHKKMGDDRWRAFLSTLYGQFLGRILTYDEFRAHIALADKERGCLAMWDRLMTQKGLPDEH